MARQNINIGSSPNKGDGEPLRTAFDKINDNFIEVYGDIQALKSGAIVADVKGTIVGDDSTILVDGVNSSINLAGTVKGDIIPDTNVAYDIGSATKRFKDLYLSGNTINLGGTALSITAGKLQVGGTDVGSTISFGELTNKPTTVAGYGITDAFDGAFGSLSGTPTTLAGYGITDAATYDQTLNTTDTVTFNTVSLGNGAVIKDNADSSVSFGGGAGTTAQGAGAVAIGEGAGNNTQSNQAVAIGRGSGNYQQGVGAVGVGFCAGATEQGDYAVAIGFKAARGNMDNDGTPNQPANSIMINASSTPLNGNQAGLYINPVREDTGNIAKAIYYNTTTKELTYADPTGGAGDGANLVSDNDINITINSPDSTSYSWNFNQLGRIEIPDVNNQVAGYIGDIYENSGLILQSVPGGYVELTTGNENVGFYVEELGPGVNPLINPEAALYTTGAQWSFYQDGRTAFPGSIDLGGQALKRSSTLEERYGGGSVTSNVAVLDNYRHMTLNNQLGTVITGNFTVNFTSVDLSSDYTTRFSVFLTQGATGYYPNVFQINGAAQTLVWENGTPPTPTSSAGAIDLFEFVVYGSGIVLGRRYAPPDLSGYQTTLVSGTSIKTINGTSLLGSGDVTISASGADLSAVNQNYTPDTNNTYDLGIAAGNFLRSGYFKTSVVIDNATLTYNAQGELESSAGIKTGTLRTYGLYSDAYMSLEPKYGGLIFWMDGDPGGGTLANSGNNGSNEMYWAGDLYSNGPTYQLDKDQANLQIGAEVTKTISGVTLGATTSLNFSDPYYANPNSTVTITGVVGTTELNNQTYFINSSNELFTDAALTTPLNSSAFTAYVSGGTAVVAPRATASLPVLHSAPTTPKSGMMAVADGTNWNPTGTGTETMVVYLGGAWRTIANA